MAVAVRHSSSRQIVTVVLLLTICSLLQQQQHQQVQCFPLFGAVPVTAYQGISIPTKKWSKQLSTGYKLRVAADPSFPVKSITEVLLAAGTQLTAEWNRRGRHRLLPEIDFVIPAILTAIFGKYYRYVFFLSCSIVRFVLFCLFLLVILCTHPRVYVKFLVILCYL